MLTKRNKQQHKFHVYVKYIQICYLTAPVTKKKKNEKKEELFIVLLFVLNMNLLTQLFYSISNIYLYLYVCVCLLYALLMTYELISLCFFVCK